MLDHTLCMHEDILASDNGMHVFTASSQERKSFRDCRLQCVFRTEQSNRVAGVFGDVYTCV